MGTACQHRACYARFRSFNVQLMLLSGIGKPYDPQTGQGVVGRNYAYQTTSSVSLILKDKILNPFIATGAHGMIIDDYNGDNFDHSGLGFVGGGYMGMGQTDARPIQTRPVPAGTPKWGAQWKKATAETYQSCHSAFRRMAVPTATRIASSISTRPTRISFGRPLMRMTFDFHDNELKMSAYLTDRLADIAKAHGSGRDDPKPAQGSLRHYNLPDHS